MFGDRYRLEVALAAGDVVADQHGLVHVADDDVPTLGVTAHL